jgi:tetratricopeptide (TPR) repeat protein
MKRHAKPVALATAALLAFLLSPYGHAGTQVDSELEQLRHAATSPGADEYAWLDLGRACLQRGLVDEAIGAFRKAVERAPLNILTYDWLGVALVRKGLLDEAREVYRRVASHGLQTMIHLRLADEYFERGEMDKAEEEYRHTIALGYYDDRALDRYRGMALRHLAADRTTSAGEMLERLVELRPGDEQAVAALQDILRRQGRDDEAQILQLRYELWLYEVHNPRGAGQLRDERVRLRIALGDLYVRVRKMDEAQRVLEQAVEINYDINIPLAVEARFRLGVVYYLRRAYDRAIQQLERVLRFDPAHREAREYLERARRERVTGSGEGLRRHHARWVPAGTAGRLWDEQPA